MGFQSWGGGGGPQLGKYSHIFPFFCGRRLLLEKGKKDTSIYDQLHIEFLFEVWRMTGGNYLAAPHESGSRKLCLDQLSNWIFLFRHRGREWPSCIRFWDRASFFLFLAACTCMETSTPGSNDQTGSLIRYVRLAWLSFPWKIVWSDFDLSGMKF